LGEGHVAAGAGPVGQEPDGWLIMPDVVAVVVEAVIVAENATDVGAGQPAGDRPLDRAVAGAVEFADAMRAYGVRGCPRHAGRRAEHSLARDQHDHHGEAHHPYRPRPPVISKASNHGTPLPSLGSRRLTSGSLGPGHYRRYMRRSTDGAGP